MVESTRQNPLPLAQAVNLLADMTCELLSDRAVTTMEFKQKRIIFIL